MYTTYFYRNIGQTMTTVKEEIKHNVRLGKNLKEFTHLMENLNLPPPSRLGIEHLLDHLDLTLD